MEKITADLKGADFEKKLVWRTNEGFKEMCIRDRCIRAWAHFNLVQLYAKRYEAGKDNTQDGIPYR